VKPGRSPYVISVVDADEEERRDRSLLQKAQAARGKRGRPPKLERLKVVTILVEDFESRGIPFATARDSRMNKVVQHWLKAKMGWTISADAVRDLLKQVAKHRR
jgi:hypothetical protein